MPGLFWKSYANRWWCNTVSIKSKTWMVTASNHFLSLIFNFLVWVYVCVCVRACVCLFILSMSSFLLLLKYYLSLLSLLFIWFWHCFYSFCWKHQDSNYRKFRKRVFWNYKDKRITSRAIAITTNTIEWMNEWMNECMSVYFITVNCKTRLNYLKLITFSWYVDDDLVVWFSRNLEEWNL